MPAKKIHKQEMVDFGTAIGNFWSKYVTFEGTAQRSEYWFARLFLFLCGLPLLLVYAANPREPEMYYFLTIMWDLATFLPCWSLMSRRFHDAGFSAKWFFLPLMITIAISLFSICLMAIGGANESEEVLIMGTSFLVLALFALFGFSVFWFVVTLLPSKFEDNKYRK